MTEAALSGAEALEFEVRGGLWEALHVIVFYAAVVSALLAIVTHGTLSLLLLIACVVFLFYSMFTIFSSPTYVATVPGARELSLVRYRYFIPFRSRIARDEVLSREVVESPRLPAREGRASGRDLSYYVRAHLRKANGRRLKLFSAGMTGAPFENRLKAYYIVEGVARALDAPVAYNRRGAAAEEDSGGEGSAGV